MEGIIGKPLLEGISQKTLKASGLVSRITGEGHDESSILETNLAVIECLALFLPLTF